MVKGEASIVINRPIAEVFAFVADDRNASRWQPGVVSVRREPEGSTGVGTKVFEERIVFPNKRIIAVAEVVEFEEHQKIHERNTDGPMDVDDLTTFRAVEGGTEVTICLTLTPKGFLKLIEPFMGLRLQSEIMKGLRTLKPLLEGGQ